MGLNDIKKVLPKPVLTTLRKTRYLIEYPYRFVKYNSIQDNYTTIVEETKKRIAANGRIRVGFYIVFDSTWGSRPVFEQMMKDPLFDIKVVVCPDMRRSEEYRISTYNTTLSSCIEKYGEDKVLGSIDCIEQSYLDWSDCFDIVSLAYPYDDLSYYYYSTRYLVYVKHKLTFYCGYGYSGKLKMDIDLCKEEPYNIYWKHFVDNESSRICHKKALYVGEKNIVVSGYSKMDMLNSVVPKSHSSYDKTIIIAPHHTINEAGSLYLSNFLRLSDLILELPKLYPNIKFIFRPHPLLFPKLESPSQWGKEKVDVFFRELLQNSNVEYSTKADYFEDFMDSDAMIDDCGSFLAEYFYTGKPQCYVLQSEAQLKREYLEFGKRLFEYVYKAFNREDILQFIDKVIVTGFDTLKAERDAFAKKEIMINYPSASKFIVEYIKNELAQ